MTFKLLSEIILMIITVIEIRAGFISEWRGDKIKRFEHFQKAILLVLIEKM